MNTKRVYLPKKRKKARCVVAISAGKGGVGKSSLTVCLAEALSLEGYAVGVLDADVYGPSLGKMMPLESPLQGEGSLLIPGSFHGIKIFSLAHLKKEGEPMAVRAPLVNEFLLQSLERVVFGELDFLFVDLPPGTGDVHLTLMQEMVFSGALLVTTPQEISLLDVIKGAKMFSAMGVPLLGVVENMSYFEEGGRQHKLFGEGGGAKLAQALDVPLLGQLPLDPLLCKSLDEGKNPFIEGLASSFISSFYPIISSLKERLEEEEQKRGVEGVEVRGDQLVLAFERGEKRCCPSSRVQQNCPCVVCKEVRSPLDPHVSIVDAKWVGSYALNVRFSSGCSNGLFPLSLLHTLSEEYS